MSSTRLVIDLEKFEPVECPAQLRAALGYHSDAEIRRHFSSWPHLQNLSYMRLYELGLQGRVKPVRLLNRQGRVAGIIRKVAVNHDRSLMRLTVESDGSSGESPALRRLVSFHLDARGVITSVLSGEPHHQSIPGCEFSRAIAPPGWAERLYRVYSYRFRKGAATRLRHPTSFPGGGLYFGQWRLEKLPDGSFKADFHTAEPATQDAVFRMRVTLKGRRTEVAVDPGFLALVPMSVDAQPPRLEDYMAAILPEDRQWVREVLRHEKLPGEHGLVYRVADQSGVVQTLCHHISRSDTKGGIRHLDSRLTLVEPEKINRVAVNTLAMAFGLESRFPESGGKVCLPGFQNLASYLLRLKALLEQDAVHQTIAVTSHEANPCSICHQEPPPGPHLQLELPGLQLSLSQLTQLVSSDASLFRIGQRSAWKSWFSELHTRGFHLAIGLGDRSQATIGIFTGR